MKWNVFRLICWDRINRVPFDTLPEAIDFAQQQIDDLTYVVKDANDATNKGQILVRKGEVIDTVKRILPCSLCGKNVSCMPDDTSPWCEVCLPF